MINKYHWKHYCDNCKASFISDSMEIQCAFCDSLELKADYVPKEEVTGLLETKDFQEFCNKLQKLLGVEND